MGQVNTIPQTDQPRPNTFTPRLVKPRIDDQETRYLAALALVQIIDENLTTGRQHYRTRSGQLLRTLDEVIRAILADNLLIEAEEAAWEQELARAA